MSSVYQFAIANMRIHLRSEENRKLVDAGNSSAITAFKVAEILAIAFMTDETKVLADLVA